MTRLGKDYEYASSAEITYLVRMMDLRNSTTLRSPQVHHDPIFTPLFTALLAGLNISSPWLATALSAIATTALVTGVQMLLAPKPPKAEDGKAPKMQAIPYRYWGIGMTRLAGAFMLWESKDDRLFSVQGIAGHLIEGYERFFLHDDEVTLSGDTVDELDSGAYDDNVKIYTRVGLNPETPYDALVSRLSSQDIWTTSHRGDGQASIAMVCKTAAQKNQSKIFPYGAPQLSVVAKLARCWDYRDPAQSPANPSTWTWTQNSALQLCWHECFNEFGKRRDYRKAILPVLDMWKEEADICDELVPRASGGFEKRYECNGWDTTENDPKVATNAILASCDGWLCERGDGALLLTVGKFRESRCGVLTDDDIVGHQIQYDVLPEDEINRLVPKFTYPATDYTTSDTDFFESTVDQLVAGRVLARDADFGWVHQWRQARRLGFREWKRIQEKLRGNLDVRLSGINAVYYRWNRMQTPVRLPRFNGKIIENRRSVLALLTGAFRMDIVKHPDNIDAWNPATDEGAPPPIPPKPESDGIPVPTIDTLTAVSGSGSVYLRVVVLDPDRDDIYPVVKYRIKDVGGGVPGAWVEQAFPNVTPATGLIVTTTSPVPNDKLLQVEVTFIGSDGTESKPTTPLREILATVDAVAPGVVTMGTRTGGAGTATINWTTPNSSNYVAANIYRNTVNNEGTASLVRTEFGGPSAGDGWVNTGLAAGTYYYWLKSRNGSGVESASVATGAIIVT